MTDIPTVVTPEQGQEALDWLKMTEDSYSSGVQCMEHQDKMHRIFTLLRSLTTSAME